MKLDDIYSIETNSYNFILNKVEVTEDISPKTGKAIVRSDSWYFPKLKQTLKRYVNEVVRPSKSVEEVIQKLNKLEEIIDRKYD